MRGVELPANLRSGGAHPTTHAATPGTLAGGDGRDGRGAAACGERFQSVRLPADYRPAAPEGTGTDDYRCFLVDPGFETDQLVSGVQIAPQNAAIVHHVIVSKVEPGDVACARALDA